MTKLTDLAENLTSELKGLFSSISVASDEITLECEVSKLKATLQQLRIHELFLFDQLIDLCAVDYLSYGEYDWETESATESGFSRGVERQEAKAYALTKPRFAVV